MIDIYITQLNCTYCPYQHSDRDEGLKRGTFTLIHIVIKNICIIWGGGGRPGGDGLVGTSF